MTKQAKIRARISDDQQHIIISRGTLASIRVNLTEAHALADALVDIAERNQE